MAYDSDKKPSELTALTSLATDDVFIVGDTSDTNEVAKYITKANTLSDFGAATQTLTNKTIDGNSNTISNLAIGAEVTGASTDLTDTSAITYNADTDVSANGWVIDEDTMASDSATKVPTQQSVKAYVDSQAGGGGISNLVEDTTPQLGGALDMNGNDISVSANNIGFIDPSGNEILDFNYTASAVNHLLVDNASTGNHPHISAAGDDANINVDLIAKGSGVVRANSVEVATVLTALMDSEVTNLAAVKAFDPTDYATAAQGSTADSALQDITGESVGSLSDVTLTTPGVDELLFTQDGSTWINQTLAEAGIQGVLSEGAFVDGDKTKLDGIEASADVTDTANVTAAGALMDSEVTNLAAVKAFDPTDYIAATGDTMEGDLAMGDYDITGAGSISFTQQLDNGSKTASFSVDFSTDNHQKATLTANTMTITFDTTSIGVGVYTLMLVNPGLATITWAGETGSVYWADGTEPTWTSSGTDIISVFFDGTNFYCQAGQAFA